MAIWSARPDWQVLYSNLDLKESGNISEELSKQGINYRLDNGGRTILVSSRDISRAKVTLASNGMPTDNRKGYELFDNSKFGVTRFEQEVNFFPRQRNRACTQHKRNPSG